MRKNYQSGNFQLSPDFRQRASSNASSVGRLSPIPSLAIENDWDYALVETDTANGNGTTNLLLEDLAGTLADELTLQSDLFNGSVLSVSHKSLSHQTIIFSSFIFIDKNYFKQETFSFFMSQTFNFFISHEVLFS